MVKALDEQRDIARVVQGLQGLSPARSHLLRGRVLFMESHDTATSDRYGRFPAAVHNGNAFMVATNGQAEAEACGDAFQKLKGSLPYPDVVEVEANHFAARRTAIAMVLMMTAPGVPMLLQGQEVYECRGYAWPRGPALDWQRVDGLGGISEVWQTVCKNLIKVRTSSCAPRASPFIGDGVHICHAHGGVLACLRWAESLDSRINEQDSLDLGLVVLNCTNTSFPSYELGVPPSSQWRLVLNTVSGSVLSSGDLAAVVLQTQPNKANHDFPCTLALALPSYSALVLVRVA